MRTNVKLLTLSAVIAGLLICICVGIYIAWMNRATKYTLTPEQSQGLFAKTPEEFVKNPRPTTEVGNEWLGLIFCKSAKVDKDGNLVFALTAQQKKSWKTSNDIQKRINNARRDPDITFSADFTAMTVRCFRETAAENVEISAKAMAAFFAFQLIDGVSPDAIAVEITYVDAGTGETVFVNTYTLSDTYILSDPNLYSSKTDFDL